MNTIKKTIPALETNIDDGDVLDIKIFATPSGASATLQLSHRVTNGSQDSITLWKEELQWLLAELEKAESNLST